MSAFWIWDCRFWIGDGGFAVGKPANDGRASYKSEVERRLSAVATRGEERPCEDDSAWTRSSPSLPTTGSGETGEASAFAKATARLAPVRSSKYAFCETNSPVKWRVMNGLGDRGCEFGGDRLGKQLGAEVVDETVGRGPYMFLRNEPNLFRSQMMTYVAE